MTSSLALQTEEEGVWRGWATIGHGQQQEVGREEGSQNRYVRVD